MLSHSHRTPFGQRHSRPTVVHRFLASDMRSPSLTVSIPVLHSWTKLMAVQEDQILDNVLSALPTLLDVCSERLLRYEALPDDSNDELIEFLNEDFDTTPERHAFLGNYRRIATPSFRDNQGFSAWTEDVAELPAMSSLRDKADRDEAEAMSALQQWCSGLVGVPVQDPSVAAQVLQALVTVLRIVPAPLADFVLSIVQQILNMSLEDNPAHENFLRGGESV
ncbi:hypothetical protein MRB53_038066 [Persea americana]|nr:hypothetical protein MRB53_038066 [Persea americana]